MWTQILFGVQSTFRALKVNEGEVKGEMRMKLGFGMQEWSGEGHLSQNTHKKVLN